jgi:hypothetical protein
VRSILLDQPARVFDLDWGEHLELLLRGAGLQLEELPDVMPLVVRADGVSHGAGDYVKAGKPGDGAEHRVKPPLSLKWQQQA